MVGGDVEQHGDVGMEVVHVVELERRNFEHEPVGIAFFFVFCHAQCHGSTDVSGEFHVVTGLAQDVIDERSGRSLAVRTGDAEQLSPGVASGKFEFGENGHPLLTQRFDHGGVVGNAGTFHHFVGIEDLLGGVLAFFPRQSVRIEQAFVVRTNAAAIGNEDIISFLLGENGGADSTFGGTENNKFHNYGEEGYRILRVMMVSAAKRMVVIQKRTVIFASCQAPLGQLRNR